jgi:cobalamin biosynthetic protein CobC
VIDESFCDVMPGASLIHMADRPGVIVLKSFGKFWGLAGLRLGFAIAQPDTIDRLAEMIGPWAVSGPALTTGTRALQDQTWAEATRDRLARDTDRLDAMMTGAGARVVGGTTLFRLYDVGDAAQWQDRLARHHIWSRIFPYSDRWLRLGLPGPAAHWDRLQEALP